MSLGRPTLVIQVRSFPYLRVFLAFPDANGVLRRTDGHGPSLTCPLLAVSSITRIF